MSFIRVGNYIINKSNIAHVTELDIDNTFMIVISLNVGVIITNPDKPQRHIRGKWKSKDVRNKMFKALKSELIDGFVPEKKSFHSSKPLESKPLQNKLL